MGESDDANASGLAELIEHARQSAGATFDWGGGDQEVEEEQLSLLQFKVGSQLYAISGEHVREVISYETSTPLPGAPPYLEGIVVHRRQVLGVLDLDAWLELDSSTRDYERVIIVEHGSFQAGIGAAASTKIIQLVSSQLSTSLLDGLPPRSKAYTKAVCETPEALVLVLDIAKLLEDAAVRG